MYTTPAFITTVLPAGKIPHFRYVDDRPVTIPFAAMAWDDGLDYDIDGNAYQDNPPGEFVDGAFLTREEAEAYVAGRNATRTGVKGWVEENYVAPLYEFTSLYWAGKMGNYDMAMTEEEAEQAIKAEQEAEARKQAAEAKEDEYDALYETMGG